VVSLICGLLFCIPVLTGLIAVITGLVGIKSTGKPNVTGRGMAITGLILGLLALIAWPLIGLAMYGGFKAAYAMAQKSGVEFTNAIIDGDYDKAMKFTASGMKKEELQKMNQDMKGWGSLTSIGFPSNVSTQKTAGGDVIEVKAPATFTNAGAKEMTITLITEKNPTTGVDDLKIGGISFK
jgi:hypothetical protein